MVNQSQFIEKFGTIKSPSSLCDVLTVGDAVERGIIAKPMDGNHGSKHPTADEYVASGIPFLLANNITEEGVDLKHCSFITKERASLLDKGFAHNGDVLLTHKGTVGRTAILKCPDYDFVMLTPQVTYYRPLKGLSAEYLKAFFESQSFQEEIMSIASSGATRAYIGITEQRKLHLLIPDSKRQNDFVSFVQRADKSKFAGFKSQFFEMTKASNSIKIENVAKDVFAGGDKPKDHSAVQSEQYKYPVFSNGIGDNALLCFSKECRVKEAAITVSARGTIGYAECREAGFTPVVRLLTLIPKEGYQLAYLKFALNSITFHSTGSSQGQLTAPDFCKYEIPNAPFDVQVVFGSKVQQADKSKFELKQAIEKIDKVMRALMQ